jgi:prepilin-type N-terminal cleavage/methylation domain-containing protein
MWTADRERRVFPPRRRREHGYSFIEMAICVAILAILALAAQQTLGGVSDASALLDAMRRVEQRTEELAHRVHKEVSASRKMFFRGTVGSGYLAALDISRLGPAPGTRLALPDEADPLGPDRAGLPRTANVLLFARESDPYTCPADPSLGTIRYVDVYRFVCIYPSETGQRVLSRSDRDARDLVIWRSAGYPSYPQLMAVSNAAERARIVAELYRAYGYRFAWNPDGDAGASFYALSDAGAVSPTAEPSPRIPEDRSISLGSQLVYANLQLARTDANSATRRSVLTQDDPASWVPDGFEVKIVGNSSCRRIWFRLVVDGQSHNGREAVHVCTLSASCRDL